MVIVAQVYLPRSLVVRDQGAPYISEHGAAKPVAIWGLAAPNRRIALHRRLYLEVFQAKNLPFESEWTVSHMVTGRALAHAGSLDDLYAVGVELDRLKGLDNYKERPLRQLRDQLRRILKKHNLTLIEVKSK